MGAGNSRASPENATPPDRPSDGTRSPGLRTGDRAGDEAPAFSAGDVVRVTDDLERMKRLQLGHGGYVDSMRKCLGQVGAVLHVFDSRDVRMLAGGGIWTFNPLSLTLVRRNTSSEISARLRALASGRDAPAEPAEELMRVLRASLGAALGIGISGGSRSSQYSVGQKVKICGDITRVKLLQMGHGGYNGAMAPALGRVGKIVEIDSDGDLKVKCGSGTAWCFNPDLVEAVSDADAESADSDSDDVPAALRRIMQDVLRLGPTEPSRYSVGQKVKICGDVDRVKLLQMGHGGYTSSMASTLGRVGRIVEIDSDGDLKVKCGSETAWCFNPRLVEAVSDADAEPSDSDSDDGTAAFQRIMRAVLGAESTEGSGGGTEKLKVTPLQSACFQGNESVVNMMITTGADLNEGDKDGDTPLHYAVYGHKPEMLELLVNFGADVNARNKKMYTAIHIAVNKEFVSCVRVLTKYTGQLDINTQDQFGDTPLHDAVGKENQEIVDLLVNFPTVDFTVQNKRSFNIFHQAALKGNTHATEKILSKKPELVDSKKKDGYCALHLAAVNGYYNLAKSLLTKGHCTVDLKNNEQQTALLLAVYKGQCDLVELLVEAGANINEPDEDGDTPMHVSLMRRSEIKVNSLSSVRAPATRMIANELLQSGTPGVDGDLALACFLSNRGGDLHKKNKAGRTPLDMAGGIAGVELLLTWKTKRSVRETSSPEPTSGGAAASAASAEGNCKMCLDAPANVWFEPCGHHLYCSECSRRMKCCLTCDVRITGKVSDAERAVPSDDQRELESRLKQLEEAHTCGICMDRQLDVAFLCGHRACARCAENLSDCHVCRKPIAEKITLY